MPSHAIDIFTSRLNIHVKQRIFCHHFGDDKGHRWSDVINHRVARTWRRIYPNSKPKNVKSLRHTRTTEWIEAGIDPDVIGTWLGHVDGSKMVLAIYAHRRALKAFANPSPLLLANPSQGHT